MLVTHFDLRWSVKTTARKTREHLLPELNHRRRGVEARDVGGVFSIVVDAVLCGQETARLRYQPTVQQLFSSDPPESTCVPVVSTAGPGQLGGKAVEEVEDCPGQDHDVVDVEMSLNHLRRIADTWTKGDTEGVASRTSGLVTLVSSRQVRSNRSPSNSGQTFLQQVMPPSLVN